MRGSTGSADAERGVDGGQRARQLLGRGTQARARGRRSRRGMAAGRGASAVETSSVDGDFSIVAWSAAGSRTIASKVSAMWVNTCACAVATGAASADARPRPRKNWSRSVRGSERFSITGVRWRKNGFSDSIASFSDRPRPAKASPKPTVASRTWPRVLPWKTA